MTIDNSHTPSPSPKGSWYTLDPLPCAIYCASGKYFSTLATPSKTPQYFIQTLNILSIDTNLVILQRKRGSALGTRIKRICKPPCYISPHVLLIRRFITVMSITVWRHIQVVDLFNMKIVWTSVKFIGVFASHISIISPVEIFLWIFYSCYNDTTILQPFCMLCLKLWPCNTILYF